MKRTSLEGNLTKSDAPLALEKADGTTGEIAGHASVFWEVDSYGEATEPGSFIKTITERGPGASRNRIHLKYDHTFVCGRHDSLIEDELGLSIEAKASDDGMHGTLLRAHLKDEIDYGLSIGYRVIRYREATASDPLDFSKAPNWLRDQNGEFDPKRVVILQELKLNENSAVPQAAVDSAYIESYRSQEGIDQLEKLLDSIKAGNLTPAQKTVLARIADLAPAALTPTTGGGSPEKADSDGLDDLFLEIEMFVVERQLAA